MTSSHLTQKHEWIKGKFKVVINPSRDNPAKYVMHQIPGYIRSNIKPLVISARHLMVTNFTQIPSETPFSFSMGYMQFRYDLIEITNT